VHGGHSTTQQAAPHDSHDNAKVCRGRSSQQKKTVGGGGLAILSHLPEHCFKSSDQLPYKYSNLHPSVIEVGLKQNRFKIVGSNERCRSMLHALKLVLTLKKNLLFALKLVKMIEEYRTPSDKQFSRDLEARLNHHIEFLANCRLLSSNMRNAIRVVKLIISNVNPEITEDQARKDVLARIDFFVKTRIELASKEVVRYVSSKIQNGDVILVYGCSTSVLSSLKHSSAQGKKFRVVVVDSRPRLEGKTLLKELKNSGLDCTYILLNAVSYLLREVTKVLLGAHTFFANGHMLARVGSAMISLLAKVHSVPVIVCCESYKFSSRVQIDSLVYNELINEDCVVPISDPARREQLSEALKSTKKLHTLHLLYDVTPPELIDVIATEFGLVPTTSVPVILREYDVAKNEANF
jgi:translation initiation factor eIF-2B subunit delta